MKIKRIKKLKVNSYAFDVKWNKAHNGASFCYADRIIEIGVRYGRDDEIFQLICHELMELCAVEQHVRFKRPNVDSDYIFMYDHRQHDAMMSLFASLVSQFIGDS